MRRRPTLILIALLGGVARADDGPPPQGAPGAPPAAPAPRAAAPEEPPRTPEQASDAVLAAWKAMDDAGLKALAANDDPDPWLVADELVRRGEHEAADQFAKAAPRKDVEKLPRYVASRRGAPPDATARKALAEVNAALGAGRWSEALALIEATQAGGDAMVGVRLAFGRGLAHAGAERFGEAVASFVRAADEAEALGWLARASRGRLEASEAAEAAKDLASAAASLEAALAIDDARGRSDAQAPMLARLGALLVRRGELEKAVGVLERAVAAFEALGRRSDAASALGSLGNTLGRLRRWPEALSALERALALFEAAGDLAAQAKALNNIVLVERSRGDIARGRAACVRLLAVAEAAGDAVGATRARLALGSFEQGAGDYAAALATYGRALAEARSRGDEVAVATAMAGIGNVRASRGEHAAALVALERAKGMFEALGDRARAATVQRSVAGVQYLIGQHEAAAANYEGALAVFEALGDQAQAAKLLASLGNVQEALGSPEDALASYRRALEMQEALGDRAEAARTLLNIGTLQEEAEAIVTFERARVLLEALGERGAAANALLNIGLARASMGAHAAALRTLERARAALEEIGDRLAAARARGGIGQAHLGPGETAKALVAAREAVSEVSALATGLGAEESVGARDELAVVYEIGAAAAAAAGDPAQLAFFLESSRAGALLEGLRAQPLLWSATVPTELRAAEGTARAAVTAATHALTEASSAGDFGATRAARAALESAREQLSAAVARIQREAKAGAAIVAPEAAPLSEVQATLADGDVLVIYGESLHELLALVATKADARIVRLGSPERVQEAAAALTFTDVEVDPAAPLETMRRLTVDPLGLGAKVSRVLVSPTGALAYVPFVTLFGDRDVVLVPSGTTLRLLREDGARRGSGVLALGDPDYGGRGGLVPLPATGVEVRAVGDVVLAGRDATEQGLRAALAGRPRWRSVHLACHGLVDTQFPMRSSLAVTATGEDDGFLSAVDIFGIRTPADLVVLSACETGRGRDYRAEGMVGLMRAFMFAGAPRVICSLWKVDDEATRALMTRFYELWNPKDGDSALPTAAALRKAQEFVRSQEKWKHPYYWAAWVLWGLPD